MAGSSSPNRPLESGDDHSPNLKDVYMAVCLLALAAGHLFTPRQSTASVMETDGNNAPPPAPPPQPPGHHYPYYCRVCGKGFPAYQGLGGHTAGHHRQPTQLSEGESSSRPLKMQRVEKVHECKTCTKVFPTGQALGGHMRSHYQGDLSRQARNGANYANITNPAVTADVKAAVLGNVNEVVKPPVEVGESSRAAIGFQLFKMNLNHEPQDELEKDAPGERTEEIVEVNECASSRRAS